MKSRVHPKYKTRYRVTNWAAYDSVLVQRGMLTIWLSPETIGAWKPVSAGKRGGQLKFSDLAIETALTLRLTADAAYDTIAVCAAAEARGAKVVLPPTRTATVSRRKPRSAARDRTIREVEDKGKRQWKEESGYHRQGTVENVFFRFESIIGDRLRARNPRAQETEALLSCSILYQMSEFGMPVSTVIRE